MPRGDTPNRRSKTMSEDVRVAACPFRGIPNPRTPRIRRLVPWYLDRARFEAMSPLPRSRLPKAEAAPGKASLLVRPPWPKHLRGWPCALPSSQPVVFLQSCKPSSRLAPRSERRRYASAWAGVPRATGPNATTVAQGWGGTAARGTGLEGPWTKDAFEVSGPAIGPKTRPVKRQSVARTTMSAPASLSSAMSFI